jgi:hypothetical protein
MRQKPYLTVLFALLMLVTVGVPTNQESSWQVGTRARQSIFAENLGRMEHAGRVEG